MCGAKLQYFFVKVANKLKIMLNFAVEKKQTPFKRC